MKELSKEAREVLKPVVVVVAGTAAMMIIIFAVVFSIQLMIRAANGKIHLEENQVEELTCDDKVIWFKNNTDSFTLYMFADSNSTRWYAESVIDEQKLATTNAVSACAAINAMLPVANAFIQSRDIAKGDEDE